MRRPEHIQGHELNLCGYWRFDCWNRARTRRQHLDERRKTPPNECTRNRDPGSSPVKVLLLKPFPSSPNDSSISVVEILARPWQRKRMGTGWRPVVMNLLSAQLGHNWTIGCDPGLHSKALFEPARPASQRKTLLGSSTIKDGLHEVLRAAGFPQSGNHTLPGNP
jgi:hypothetical protein